MRLPTWDELLEEQKEVLEHPLDEPLFVAGPPGSGKTVLAVGRARALAEGDRSVTVVTFNRMLRRLVTVLNENEVDARTMNSFVWHDYIGRTRRRPQGRGGNSYEYDWAQMLDTLDGHENSAPTRDHVVVDEGQDLAEGFFEYVAKHGADVLTVFADDDQSLGERRTTLEQIRNAANLPNPILLSENHRNAPEIAAIAEHFHCGRLPAARVRRPPIGTRPRLVSTASPAATAQFIARWYETRGGSIGVVVDQNNTGREVKRALRHLLPGRRVDRYDHKSQNEDQIALLSPGVTVLNRESVKGQEFDTLFVLELERFIPCATDAALRVMYMLCARARDNLLLVYGPDELSDEQLADLPGEDILERG